jgi:hypothetical protein
MRAQAVLAAQAVVTARTQDKAAAVAAFRMRGRRGCPP